MKFPWKSLCLAVVLCSLLTSCSSARREKSVLETPDKIAFDLSRLNSDGLQGPQDGFRALHYEFCIPADDSLEAEVLEIDPTLQVFRNAKGRIRCGEEEYLCLGNTHQPHFQAVLKKLAELTYVERIEESFFED